MPMPRTLIALLACASGLSVANVYYAQPLLDALASDFSISRAAVGGVITATQLGTMLALLLLVPLGDLLPRRRLMLVQLLALALALVCVSRAASVTGLMAGMLMVGMLGSAMTQGLIAYAATASAASERGRVVGAAQGGVVAGLLLARVMAGLVADLAGWRAVYGCSAAAMLCLSILLWRALPAQPPQPQRMTYGALIFSMLGLLRHDRVLRVRGVIALLMFAVFNIFWSALALLLSAPPYGYSTTVIGAFGLIGFAGALAASRAGRWADRGWTQRTSAGALLLMLLAWLPLAWAPSSLPALVMGILLLDLGVQALQVANQSMIFNAHPDATSRVVGCYMMYYAAGSGAGALAATSAYAAWGWSGVCVLGATVSLAALLFWAATASGHLFGIMMLNTDNTSRKQ